MTVEKKLLRLIDVEAKKIDFWYDSILGASHDWKDQFKKIMINELSGLALDETGARIRPDLQSANVLAQIQIKLPELFKAAGIEDYTDEIFKALKERIETSNKLWEDLGLDAAKLSAEEVQYNPEILDQLSRVSRAIVDGNSVAQNEVAQILYSYRQT